MNKITYTTEDMKELAACSSSELASLLEDIDYNPEEFEQMMRGLPKDHKFLFDTPMEDLPEHIDNPRLMGFLNFRMKAGK